MSGSGLLLAWPSGLLDGALAVAPGAWTWLQVTSMATLCALVVVWLAGGRWGLRGAVVLFALALLWVPLNKPMEGVVLLRLADDQGFTQADLVPMLAGATAVWRAFAARRTAMGASTHSAPPARLG